MQCRNWKFIQISSILKSGAGGWRLVGFCRKQNLGPYLFWSQWCLPFVGMNRLGWPFNNGKDFFENQQTSQTRWHLPFANIWFLVIVSGWHKIGNWEIYKMVRKFLFSPNRKGRLPLESTISAQNLQKITLPFDFKPKFLDFLVKWRLHFIGYPRQPSEPETTLSSICMWKCCPCRPSQSWPFIIIHNLYQIIKCVTIPLSLSFPRSFVHSGFLPSWISLIWNKFLF